jgi:hypothetical protein
MSIVCSTTHLFHYLFNESSEVLDSILKDGLRPLSDFPDSERWKQIKAYRQISSKRFTRVLPSLSSKNLMKIRASSSHRLISISSRILSSMRKRVSLSRWSGLMLNIPPSLMNTKGSGFHVPLIRKIWRTWRNFGRKTWCASGLARIPVEFSSMCRR